MKVKKTIFTLFIPVFISFNTYGQDTYKGTIIDVLSQGATNDPWSYLRYGFETLSGDYYILTLNSHRIMPYDKLIVEGVEYFQGDNVIIAGTTKKGQDSNSKEYIELEIESIEKWSPNIDFQHILGTYVIVEKTCADNRYPDGFSLRKDKGEGIELILSDGKDRISSRLDNYMIGVGFMMNDSLFFPPFYYPTVSGSMQVFTGRGKIKNDSIYFKYVYGSFGYESFTLINCECKGEKIDITGITLPFKSDNNKVYYDATNQVIVIDETLQNQSFTFELIDMQGKMVCSKANSDHTIDVAKLPAGIYLYRLLQNNGTIYSGKIVLK